MFKLFKKQPSPQFRKGVVIRWQQFKNGGGYGFIHDPKSFKYYYTNPTILEKTRAKISKGNWVKFQPIQISAEKMAAGHKPEAHNIRVLRDEILAYDVAISYRRDDRKTAKKLYNALSEHDLDIFFDYQEQVQLLGENVGELLTDIYGSWSRVFVPIISMGYFEGVYTTKEFDAATSNKYIKMVPVIAEERALADKRHQTRVNKVLSVAYLKKEESYKRIADLIYDLVKKSREENRR